MLLDKDKIQESISTYKLDGFSIMAKTWCYNNKATIVVFDKDAKYKQDFYYVLKGETPQALTNFDTLNAEKFDNPFDAYARFQDLLNEQDSQTPPTPPSPEDVKLPMILKNKKTNQIQIREVDANMVVGNEILAEGTIIDRGKINLASDSSFETTLFVGVEQVEVVLIRADFLDKDKMDAYLMIPKQPEGGTPPPEGGTPPPEGGTPPPEGGTPPPEDGEPEDGEPEDGEPEDGEPEDGEPEDGEPEDGEPEERNGKPKEIEQEIQTDRVNIISEVSGIDADVVKNNFRSVNLATNFLSQINFKELQRRLNTNKTAYQLAQEISTELRNS